MKSCSRKTFEASLNTILNRLYGAILVLSLFIFKSYVSADGQLHGNGETSLSESGRSMEVFGYLPEYRLSNFDYDGAFQSGLTCLIFFSLEINSQGLPSALDRLPSKSETLRARAAADRIQPRGKLILSFGGNSRSAGFPSMVASKASRKSFLIALNKILIEYQLDGVDYNWEYPANSKEWRNWGLLIKESKERLLRLKVIGDDGTKKLIANPKTTVTITMYLDRSHYEVIAQYNLLAHADNVHCMAYDNYGKHSTYEFAQQGISWAKEILGPTRYHQWTLGVPFYGRNVRNGEPKPFYDILPGLKGDNSTDMLGDIYFNSQSMIARKVELARENGVGVMIWELGQDRQPFQRADSLMHAISLTLHRGSKTERKIDLVASDIEPEL